MHVRCERCSTVYELDEEILPPGGAPVQCSRCDHVFQAHPPVAGKTRSRRPAVPGPGAARPAGPERAPRRGDAEAPGAAGASVAPAPAPVARAPSPAPSPTAPSSLATVPAAATASAPRPASDVPRQATPASAGHGETERAPGRKVRGRRTWGWLALLLVAGVALAGVLWQGTRRISPAALARRHEGLRLLVRDDRQSLEQAAEVLADASRIDPRLFQARADRALALTLMAADEREWAAALESRSGASDAAERIEPLRERAARLASQALADVEGLAGPHGNDPAVARALALHYVLDDNVELASRVVRTARAAGLADPWLDLADGAADVVTAGSEVARQRAVARLAPLAAAHPELLRARILLARAEADLGHTDAAVSALDGVLEANPGHEVAREMKERLLEPPAPAPVRLNVPQGAPPPGRPGLLPRKPGGTEP